MNSEERKKLRKDLLKDLYDQYFKNNGAKIRINKQAVDKDSERLLAYRYLQDKRLITIEYQGLNYYVIGITVNGIDATESGSNE